ncbi:MAG: NUDIX domain-containing protein [Acidimicrobiales bacterium]
MSIGLLLYREFDGGLRVLLAHLGGPFWASKDAHAWTVPKGLEETLDSDLLAVAEREFAEEMGRPAPPGPTIDLGIVKAGRKTNRIYARAADFDASQILSNTFTLEWPPRSGKVEEFPEVDRAEWFPLDIARTKLVKGMLPFLERLEAAIGEG